MNSTTGRLYPLRQLLGVSSLDEEAISYPSKGLLLWADQWAVRISIIIFAVGAGFSLFQLDQTPATIIAWAWLLLIVMVSSIAWWLPKYSLLAPILQKVPKAALQWTAAAVPISILLSLALTYSFRVPHHITLYLWIIFLPGLVLMVRYRTRDQLKGTPVSRLTKIILAYTSTSATLISLPIAGELWDTLGTMLRIAQNGSPVVGVLIDLGVLLVPSAWCAIAMLLTYYLMRRADLDKQQAILVFRFNELLSQMEDPLESASEVAALVCALFDYQRIIILRPEEEYYVRMAREPDANLRSLLSDCSFYVAGAAGQQAQRFEKFVFPMTKGVSWRSLVTRKSQLIHDAAEHADFVEPDAVQVRSELNVPIFDKDNPKLLLAVLIAQDVKFGAYSKRDQHTLEQIGKDIAEHSRYYRRPLHYLALQEELNKLASLRDYPAIVEQALQACEVLFATQRVMFVPLGVGTGVPLANKIQSVRGAFNQSHFFQQKDAYDGDSDLMLAVDSWEPLFVADCSESPFWRQWAAQEGILALTLLPVGSKRDSIGLLLIGFEHRPWGFLAWQRLLFTSFALMFGSQLAKSHLDRLGKSLVRPTFDIHRWLSQENLGYMSFNRRLKAGDGSSNAEAGEPLSRLLVFHDRLYATTLVRTPDFERSTLDTEIVKLTSDLKSHPRFDSCQITFRIDDRVNRERPELKAIVFSFITEAVINALVHGSAKTIFIRVVRLSARLVLTVTDNGRGFDPASLQERKHSDPGSILCLATAIQDYIGGSPIDWGWTAKGLGTFIRISIPLLTDTYAPTVAPTRDWIDSMEVPPEAWLHKDPVGDTTLWENHSPFKVTR